MRQAERLIALRALLARVQENAKERRAELAALGLGPDAPRPPPPSDPPIAAPRARPPARERVPTPQGRFDDDWSSLLTRDLNDPSPERHAAPPEPPPPPAMPFSRVASFVPPPVPADLVPPPPPPPAPLRLDDDRHPDSIIGRAIRLAAEHPHPVVDPRDLWTGAGPELRERKPATNPPVPPRPEDLQPDDDDEPVLDLVRPTPSSPRVSSRPPPPARSEPTAAVAEAVEDLAPAPPRNEPPPMEAPLEAPTVPATRPHDRAPEPEQGAHAAPSYLAATRSRGRRIERTVSPRKRSARRFVAALFFAAPLAGLAAWSLLDEPRRDARDPVASATGTNPSDRRPAASAPPPAPPPIETPPGSAPTAPPAPAASATSPAKAIPPPPAPGNPRESGMLWVDADPPSAIYVQGVAAGDSSKWLEVPCGMKNVRLARPGLPPPGHSFPMWLGVGQTVLIPCGGSHRVALRPD